MAKGPAPSLDALVIKLLEVSHAANVNIPQVKNLVAQLPAAAAEVRGIQEQSRNQNGPCTCGLDEEVVRLQKQMQVYIDNEPNTKKGNGRKTMAMENQRLTKLVKDQKKEINGHLTTIGKQNQEVARLRWDLQVAKDGLAKSERIRKEPKDSGLVDARQAIGGTADYPPVQQATTAEPSMLVTQVPAANARGQFKVSNLSQRLLRLTFLAVANPAASSPRRDMGFSDSSRPRDPRLSHPLYSPSAWPNTARDTGKASFARTVEDDLEPNDAGGPLLVTLPTASKKRRATENMDIVDIKKIKFECTEDLDVDGLKRIKVESMEELKVDGIKNIKVESMEDLDFDGVRRIKLESSDHPSIDETSTRKPVCQGCRSSGADCDHGSRCAECDTHISPCKSDCCNPISVLS